MVEFKTAYTPMDKEYHTGSASSAPVLEKPIVPMSKIGQTFPEHGRTKNIVREAEAAIRAGAGVLQLVMEREGATPVGRGPSTHGKEVREAIREVMYANNVFLEGLELPTSLNNLTGLTQQGFQEGARHQSIEQVKEAIRFAADIARGGSVDILSSEFQRPVALADWNQSGKWKGTFEGSPEEGKKAAYAVVDTKSGEANLYVNREILPYGPKWCQAKETKQGIDQAGKQVLINKNDYVDFEGRKITDLARRVPEINKSTGMFEMRHLTWNDLEEEARLLTEQRRKEAAAKKQDFTAQEECTPEEVVAILRVQREWQAAQGRAQHEGRQIVEIQRELTDLGRMKEYYAEQEKGRTGADLEALKRELAQQGLKGISPERYGKPSEVVQEKIDEARRHLERIQLLTVSELQQAMQRQESEKNFKRIDKYATEKAKESYAELGLFAWMETKTNPKKVERPLCVGPENGFDYAYGGHPDEFLDLIDGARAKMVEKLKNQGMSEHAAKDAAKQHIKGVFDTGHLATFLGSFRPEKDPKTGRPIEGENRRIELFNEWYLEQIDKLAKRHDALSAIQAVDSSGSEHSHLPPGQGIFPIKNAVERIVKAGFTGAIVSEGHEEDGRYGDARILTKTWEEFTVPIGQPYGRPGPGSTPWGGPSGAFQGYFGRIQSPTMMVGAYVPSNEFRFWSETPLE